MYIHSNVEAAGEVEVRLGDERKKYDARVALHKTSKKSNPPLCKGILVFDEVKVAARLHWNSRNDALVGHSMTTKELTTLCDLYERLHKDAEDQITDYIMQSLWRDLTSDCDVVGPYYTSCGCFKAKFMLPCVMDALRKFHNHGFSVHALVCDGASSNLTMIKTLLGKKGYFTHDDSLPDPHWIQPHFMNPFTGEKLHIVVCPSHQVHTSFIHLILILFYNS